MAKRKSRKVQSKNTKSTENQKTKSIGVGDTVEKLFEASGISKVAKFVLGEDCGCSDRREVLNKMFPYQKPNCLSQDEYNYLKDYFSTKINKVSVKRQEELVAIYNRVFNDKASTTGCTSCFLNNVHKKLERVYKEYRDE
jgi:hypothetical protein